MNADAAGSLWGQALGGGGRVNSDGNGAGSTYRSGGFLAGADYALTPNWLVGVAGGYQRANWDASTNGSAPASGKVETPMGAVYARYTSGPWMIAATGSYADNKFSTSRNVTIGTSTSTASSTHHGGEWGAGLQAELALAAGSWEVRPLAGLRYARLKEEAYTESGAGAANLSVDARVSSNTTLSAGVKGVRRFGGTGNEGAFELRVIASHLYGDNDAPVSARLAGQSGSFTSNGTPLKRDALTVGAGLSKRIGKQLSGYADVSIEERGSGQTAYALSAGLRYSW
jgi:subtilase-type serine protease